MDVLQSEAHLNAKGHNICFFEAGLLFVMLFNQL